MKIIAVIPARYASTRLPVKLVQDLCGLPVIARTYLAAQKSNLFDEVWVVTDSDEIVSIIKSINGKVLKSKKEHESGSDRIAEAIENMDIDVVVNVQGDEPFINTLSLTELIHVFNNDFNKKIDVGSLMVEITDKNDIENPNHVKVVTDKTNRALYFSRSVIPYPREVNVGVRYMKHIGVYAFRKEALMDFYKNSMSTLEASEKLEQLRYLEYGKNIQMIETKHQSIGIDTEEDLIKARLHFQNQNQL